MSERPPVDFPWQVHQENIAILGMQGTGKTTLGLSLLKMIPSTPRIIISPINRASWYSAGKEITELKQIESGAYLWAGDNSKHTFEKICEIILDKIPNCVVVIDDLQEYVSKQKVPESFNSLIQSGRNRGICSIWLSPAPNLISNFVLQSAQHIYAFRMNLESQIEWLDRNYFGADAWALLPKERRKKEPVTPGLSDIEIFPKYAYLYRYYQHTENQVYLP